MSPKLCDAMNKLQMQAFEINRDLYDFIDDNYEMLVDEGLLMPPFLATVKIPEVVESLRTYYLNNQSTAKYSYQEVYLKEFFRNLQRARYEQFILKLASAYSGYKFYLPAFLDFRGRIYRAGILHFHERDLARSLIIYSDDMVHENSYESSDHKNAHVVLCASIGFHYKKFKTYYDSVEWISNIFYNKTHADLKTYIIKTAVKAKDPFQFICKTLLLYYENLTCMKISNVPITQDASASAYQIMSYFLLDQELAVHTNLIPSKPTYYIILYYIILYYIILRIFILSYRRNLWNPYLKILNALNI